MYNNKRVPRKILESRIMFSLKEIMEQLDINEEKTNIEAIQKLVRL